MKGFLSAFTAVTCVVNGVIAFALREWQVGFLWLMVTMIFARFAVEDYRHE